MKKVLVTGASGQLGQCIQKMAPNFPDLEFTYTTSEELDLSLFGMIRTFFDQKRFDFCINCAAYTQVDQAETEREKAYLVNSEAVKNLATICGENSCTLIHISTDYVFNGRKGEPFTEEDPTGPLNVYGASKLQGEEHIRQSLDKYFIIRTSWLYSDIGHNFFNTIQKKARAGEPLKITTSQEGTPTNAYDLAQFILVVIQSNIQVYGTYHFSNDGRATWYDFAAGILEYSEDSTVLEKSGYYKTDAVRPEFSVLDKSKAKEVFGISIAHWRDSLKKMF